MCVVLWCGGGECCGLHSGLCVCVCVWGGGGVCGWVWVRVCECVCVCQSVCVRVTVHLFRYTKHTENSPSLLLTRKPGFHKKVVLSLL